MKRLLLFDVDGTLTDTVPVDDRCFIQPFRDCYDLNLADTDWHNYTRVTDTGLATEVIQRAFDRNPEPGELEAFEAHFCESMCAAYHEESGDFSPIPGAPELMNALRNDDRYALAFATGGFRKTAEFKLDRVGIEHANTPFGSSNNHHTRAGIVEAAIAEACEKNGVSSFEQMAYIGDGAWDFKLSKDFGMQFFGVDIRQSGKLISLGATTVQPHFDPVSASLTAFDQLFSND